MTDPRARSVADSYERAGRQTSIALKGYSTVLLISDDPLAAVHVAIGIGRSEAAHRRVVIGDLVGDLAPLQALIPSDDSHGIYDSFVFGASLERVIREVEGVEHLGILPGGTESPATAEIIGSHRWRRIASSFAETDALLLLVVAPGAPELDKLAARVDGVLIVGDFPLETAPEAVLLARIPHPVEIPPGRQDAEAIEAPIAEPLWRSRGVSLVLLAALLLALALVVLRPGGLVRRGARAPDTIIFPDSSLRDTLKRPPRPEMVVANPGDSADAVAYSVLILSANTAEGANFELRGHGEMMPAATISLVPIGDTDSVSYKVHAGAFRDSAQAARLLRSLRRRQIVPDSEGTIVRTPFALRVDSVPNEGAVHSKTRAKVADFATRGIAVYTLTQPDGSTRLYAGAFERPEEASLAATALRVAGVTPVLEYRTGSVQ